MSNTLPALDGPTTEGLGDAELISAVRAGDLDAYGDLFARHVEAARRLARQLVSAGDADDLVSEAFAKMLAVLQRGGGPDLAFRAYLLTAIRRLHVDRIRATSRLHTTDDLTPFDPGVPFRDTAVEGFENATAARAFASLPERWQMVLWHTEVEGQKPAEVAALLGMSANSVSALAYRAREGLRQAFLSMHAHETEDDTCTWTQQTLGAYIRKGTSRRDGAKVEGHVAECRRCMAVYLELTEVNSNLSGILGPLVLGGAAAGYLGSAAGGAATKGGVLFLLDRLKDLAIAHASVTAVAGVAATAVVVGGVVVGTHRATDPQPRTDAPRVLSTALTGSGEHGPATAPTRTVRSERAAPIARNQGFTPSDPLSSDTAGASAPVPVSTVSDSGAPPSTAEPATEPAEGFTEAPDPEPTPTEPPSGPPRLDVGVSSSKSSLVGPAWTIRVSVEGLSPGGATLTVTSDAGAVALTLDLRCGLVQIGRASCRAPTTPTTFRFLAVPLTRSPTTLTFTVSPAGHGVDANTDDNSTRVTLSR